MRYSQLHYDARTEKFMPDGIPKKIRLYDNGGKTADRYMVVFTGRWAGKERNTSYGRDMSSNPYHPQGVGTWFEILGSVDTPSYSHLGKKIKFQDAPEQVQKCIVSDYKDIWELNNPNRSF